MDKLIQELNNKANAFEGSRPDFNRPGHNQRWGGTGFVCDNGWVVHVWPNTNFSLFN